MDKKTILEKLALYNAVVVKEMPGGCFMCKCRFSHIFKCSSLLDWCLICRKTNIQTKLIQSINDELEELDNDLKLFQVDEYGIGDFICPDGHVVKYDIDDIPNSCEKCKTNVKSSAKQATKDSLQWGRFIPNLRENDVESDETNYSDDSVWDEPSELDECVDSDISDDGIDMQQHTHRTIDDIISVNSNVDMRIPRPNNIFDSSENLHITNAINMAKLYSFKIEN